MTAPYNNEDLANQLAEHARGLSAEQYLAELEAADDAARVAQHRLRILTKIGFERTDVTRGQMAKALGVDRRTVYKRRDQV